MHLTVDATDSPQRVFDEAGGFLNGDPARNNLILTLLNTRIAHPEAGRYWIARHRGEACGVVLQSPVHFFATLTPMPRDAITAIVDAIADDGIHLPGVSGEAGTAATFAGHWAERTRSPARPVEGQRLLEAERISPPTPGPGQLRAATPDDRVRLVRWFDEFEAETGAPSDRDNAAIVDRRLPAGHLWIWDHHQAVSMAGLSDPVAGVVRIGPVYTPRDRRARGYASRLVAAITRDARSRDQRCILYTDLANPTSNGIYRAIGYHAVSEVVRYAFEPPH